MAKARPDSKGLLRAAWGLTASIPWPFDPEVRFHPTRRWRFDWASQTHMVAVEVEGVTHYGGAIGRHQSASGIEADCEKYNAAIELGWLVLRYSQRQIKADPVGVVEQVQRVIERRVANGVEKSNG